MGRLRLEGDGNAEQLPMLGVLAADVRKWDMDGGLGLRPDIFPSSKPLSPQAERADGSARAAG